MTGIRELLAPDYSLDYWSDDVKPRAGEALRQLEPAQWQELATHAPRQPESWRVRLAEALIYAPGPPGVAILVDLLRAPETAVAAAAAATLLRLRAELPPEAPSRAHIERRLDGADPSQREALERIARLLPT
jgi:hypothetical protein